jgi:hypothetical protein
MVSAPDCAAAAFFSPETSTAPGRKRVRSLGDGREGKAQNPQNIASPLDQVAARNGTHRKLQNAGVFTPGALRSGKAHLQRDYSTLAAACRVS